MISKKLRMSKHIEKLVLFFFFRRRKGRFLSLEKSPGMEKVEYESGGKLFIEVERLTFLHALKRSYSSRFVAHGTVGNDY